MKALSLLRFIFIGCLGLALTACSGMNGGMGSPNYGARMPQTIDSKSKVVMVDPKQHVWGAYQNGELVRAGLATSGSDICEDADRSCRTSVGTFRITSLGPEDCRSKTYPKPHGGGLMPYCMFFHDGQSLHGSPDTIVKEANLSHGCVRMRIPDAEWVRNNFAQVGTKVVVLPYE